VGGEKRVRCRTEVWLWHCIVVLIKNKPPELLARPKQKQAKSKAKVSNLRGRGRESVEYLEQSW